MILIPGWEEYGNPLEDGYFIIVAGGREASLLVTNGVVESAYQVPLTAGILNSTIYIAPTATGYRNNNYKAINTTINVTALPNELINVDLETNYTAGEDGFLNITDVYDNPLIGATVMVTVDDVSSTYTVGEDGIVDFNLTTVAGEHEVGVRVIDPDTSRVLSNTLNIVTVYPDYDSATMTLLDSDSLPAGGEGLITVLDQYGNALPNMTVTVDVDAEATQNFTVDDTGMVTYSLPDSFSQITATLYDEDEEEIDVQTITTTPKTGIGYLNATISNRTINLGDKVSLNALVYDENGEAITVGNITYSFDDGTRSVSAEIGGSINYAPRSTGSHIVTVHYSGTDYYAVKYAFLSLNVGKVRANLTGITENISYGESANLILVSDSPDVSGTVDYYDVNHNLIGSGDINGNPVVYTPSSNGVKTIIMEYSGNNIYVLFSFLMIFG